MLSIIGHADLSVIKSVVKSDEKSGRIRKRPPVERSKDPFRQFSGGWLTVPSGYVKIALENGPL